MKVLHVIPSVSPVRGGPSHAVIGMAKALCDAGCDAEIACTDDDGVGLLQVPCGERMEWHGAPVRFFHRASPRIAALREFQYSSAFSPWLRKEIGSYDLLHVHAIFSYMSSSAMLYARQASKPYIVRPIGQLSPWSLSQKSSKKRLYLTLCERRNIASARGIHCTSEAERRDVLAFDPKLSAFVSPIGLAPAERRPDARTMLRRRFSAEETQQIILYLGRLHEKKGIEELLNAVARLPADKVMLIIAGSGDHRYELTLRERATGLGLQGRVHFTGFVTGEDKDMLLQGSDIFALPSRHENFGIAVLEALMAGLPVLIADGVALADFVKKIGAGVIVEPSSEAVEAALRCMIPAGAMGEADRQRIIDATASAFSWASIARDLIDKYNGILGPRPI